MTPAIEHYTTKLSIATAQLAALYPLDTSDKISQAIAPWNELYGFIGFTTLDSQGEQSFFNHPDTAALIPATRTAVRECEAAFEIFFARQIIDCADPRAELLRFPIHVFYEHTASLEWHALTAVLGQYPTNVAILGAGALPETCVWIQDWARENKTRVRVHNVELLEDRCELGRLAVSALGVYSEDTTFEAGDACAIPANLQPFDAVYFNATVGVTVEEKESAIVQVSKRMRNGSPTTMTSPALLEVLRPVLTYHMNGEVGKSINTSIIVSRIV
ncbi:uncharacterized protein PgNI_09244 [Pyricularia grisea]|uniref:Nicotianamine synthase n=1 Tax=Pyricularia grisea TaxID=148305 RepID=A0A6P8AS83_PYRGI|nr:uncharacterized protein PgNI_09244 [Pyricularia grisea]TLD04986.1 hypothetical protein PgNI_09244 [Pyricularia grisea]